MRRALLTEALVVIAIGVIAAEVVTPADLTLVRGRVRQQWLGHASILSGPVYGSNL
jgi:hypothetical protein